MSFICVSGHAPHADSMNIESNAVQEWWSMFASIYRDIIAPHDCVIYGLDINHSFTNNVIGRLCGGVAIQKKSPQMYRDYP